MCAPSSPSSASPPSSRPSPPSTVTSGCGHLSDTRFLHPHHHHHHTERGTPMKIRHSKRAAAVLAVAVVASAGFAAAAHGATTDHDVRASDFNSALADQRTNGHLDFLKEGVRLYTDGNADTGPRTDGGTGDWNTDKVAQYYAPASTTMPTSSGQDWYGTDSAPGMQIVFDYDGTTGNGNDYNVLVGEKVYNGTWWLTNGSSTDAKAADPSGTNDGGNGSAYFGTLQQWKDAMPAARVLAYGFSLGSGVKGDGVLRSQTFGDDSYVFTDEAAPTTPPEPTTVNP